MESHIAPTTCVAVLLLAVTCGCAATGYHPDGVNGGYEECRIQQGIYRIDFHGNRYTSKSTVKDFVLLRAAELTLQEGHSYFETIEKESAYLDTVRGTDDWLTTLHLPNASLVIRCLDEKPEGDGIVYDAVQICDNIRAGHRITPKTSSGKETPCITPETSSKKEKPSTAKIEAIVKAAIKGSRLPKRPLLLRTLLNGQFVKKSSTDYAKKAREIAIASDSSDVEKLHSLAALSVDHAAATTNQQEKEAYTRLNEDFLREAQSLESSLALAEETTDRDGRGEESEVRQASFVEKVSD
jgi:hypothetical protein